MLMSSVWSLLTVQVNVIDVLLLFLLELKNA